jgi:hypothetical protein
MCRPVVIAGIAIHNRFPAADEFQDITSKSKPTPENPITLYVSLTQRDGRIAWVGTLAMAVGGMSSKCQSSGRLTNSLQGTWLTAITLINQTGATLPM